MPENVISYLKDLLQNLEVNKKRYSRCFWLFFALGCLVICVPFLYTKSSSIINEVPKFGFGTISTLIGVFFQNEGLKINNKISSLNYLIKEAATNLSLSEEIIKKALEQL